MIGDSEGPPDRDARKIIELDLKYETMRELQSELAPMLSNDGLFLPWKEPIETDSVVRFRVMLPEAFTLIEGTGVVVWTRGEGDEQGPSGVAVRYATLPSESQETIDAIIDAHLASGGELFNLDPDSGSSESFPTDALDHRSLDDRGAARREPMTPEEALSDLEQARLEIRGHVEPTPVEPVPAPNAEGVSLEDDYLASVEAQVHQAIAGVRDRVTQVTEPVDPELIELTTDVDAPGAPTTTEPHEPAPDPDPETVIPDFLDRWRHEVDDETGDGGRTERLDFESGVDDVVTDARPARYFDGNDAEGVMAAGDTEDARTRGRPWWIVPLGVGVGVVVVGYVIWLWSLGGDAPEPVPQVVEEIVAPSQGVVDVSVVQETEPEAGVVEEADAMPPQAPIQQPPLEPATVVVSIVWRSGADGTEVEIRGNGTIAESTVETFGLSEPPRILVRIREIQQEYSSYELPVGTPEVERIRIGHHPELTPPALYVVLDLTRPDARVTGVSIEGDTARVTVR
jgi:Tfp pilus assembly protein PilZ